MRYLFVSAKRKAFPVNFMGSNSENIPEKLFSLGRIGTTLSFARATISRYHDFSSLIHASYPAYSHFSSWLQVAGISAISSDFATSRKKSRISLSFISKMIRARDFTPNECLRSI